MKINFIVAFATTILLYACSAKLNNSNNNINKLSTDKGGKPMLLGECSRISLLQPPFGEWFEKNYANYTVNDTISTMIKPLISKKTIVVVFGNLVWRQ